MRKLIPLFATATALLSACGSQSTAPNATLPSATAPTAAVSQAQVNRPQKAAPTLNAQIVGGTITARGARPYQVALTDSSGFQFCGGTLIAPGWVMTAAHCTEGSSASSIRVRAGVNKLSSTQGQTVRVSNIYIHPSWNSDFVHGYDISLLKLSTAITDSYAAAAKLPSNSVESTLDVKGKYAVVSGWGKTSGSSNGGTDDLREVSIPITPNPYSCGGDTAPANSICGEYSQGKDSCNGDSGGPLAQSYNSNFYVLGIVSYGPDACTGYGVYTRVNGYLDWIKQISGVTPDSTPTDPKPTDPKPTDPVPTSKTYTGSVNKGYESYQPSAGFSYSGGTLKGTLTAASGTDFDLYLQKKSTYGTWSDVAASENTGSNESISYSAAAGTYRWAIYAYSGSGNYTVTETR